MKASRLHQPEGPLPPVTVAPNLARSPQGREDSAPPPHHASAPNLILPYPSSSFPLRVSIDRSRPPLFDYHYIYRLKAVRRVTMSIITPH